MLAMANSINRSQLPVGTIITSVLPPEKFLTAENPQYDKNKWVHADGRVLPLNTIYQRLSGNSYAPNLTPIEKQKIITGVTTGTAKHGQKIDQLKIDDIAKDDWHFHFGLSDIVGNNLYNDWENTKDHFQVYIEADALVSRGKTYNTKHGRWGAWAPGSANYVGIATKNNPMYYYLKIN